MSVHYDKYTLVVLREKLWDSGAVPKKWMLTYIRKSEAVYLLNHLSVQPTLPDNYVKTIKERCSQHRKKMYRSKKDRENGFGTPLTREERLRLVMNTADALIFVEVKEFADGFTSYLGSKKGRTSFTFNDSSGAVYMFTRSEVEKLSSMGLYIPRGVLTASRNKVQRPAKSAKTLKDIFGS
jgi:hypothetical protein